MQRPLRYAAPAFVLFATQAFGQVQVGVHLEKNAYLAGEPVAVIVDVLNVGDHPVTYYDSDGDITLTVVGVEPRVPPKIFGCFSELFSTGGVSAIDHPPSLAPGQTTSFRYLLKRYALRPGQYTLRASGEAAVRRVEGASYVLSIAPPLAPTDARPDAVPGARFDQAVSLRIVPAGEQDLERVFGRLISEVDGPDATRREAARTAIIEAAPPFLTPRIAQFAAEDQHDDRAIEALGRIGTEESRTQLKQLFKRTRDWRPSIVLALARVGHAGDTGFLASVLEDATDGLEARQYAAHRETGNCWSALLTA